MLQNTADGSACGRTRESPQGSVPHPGHIWCFAVSLSVKPSFKYSVYIQWTLDKKPFQIISSVCFTLLGLPRGWHSRYQPYSDVPDVVAHRNVQQTDFEILSRGLPKLSAAPSCCWSVPLCQIKPIWHVKYNKVRSSKV